MAQWNLSVDLRGRGTNLAQTLRRNAGHARDLGSAVRDARTEIRQLGTAARTSQSALRGMGGAASTAAGRLQRLERQSARAATNLRQIAEQARRAEERLRRLDTNVTIELRLDDRTGNGAALALRQVQEAAQDTARVLRTLRGRASATASAFDELRNRALLAAGGLRSLNTAARIADGRLESLNTRTTTLTSSMGDLNGALGNVRGRMGGLRGSLGTASNAMNQTTGSGQQLLVVAGMLATALLPIAATAGPIAAGLGAAGIAVGVFGIAIGGQIKALADAAEAQTKYDEAVREHGRSSPEAAQAEKERLRILRDTPAATRKAAAAYEVFTDDYKAFSDALAGDTMPVAIKTMGVFSGLMQRSAPLAKGASREASRFMTILAGGMNTQTFDSFMDRFTTFAVETLARANTGIVSLTRGLSTGKVGQNLREFLDYARQNGPAVADTLSELFSMLLKLVAAGSEAGVTMLTVVNAFAQLVNAIPTDVLSTLLQVAFALKAVQLAGMAFGAMAPGMALVAANTSRFVRAARFGGVASAIAGVTQQLTLMQRASVVLAVLALVAVGVTAIGEAAKGAPPEVDKLTTSLKNLGVAAQFTGELGKTFGDMDGLIEKMGQIAYARHKLDKFIDEGSIGIDWFDDLRRQSKPFFDQLSQGEKSLNALEEDFNGLDEAMAQLVQSGHAELAAANFQKIAAAARAEGHSLKDVQGLMPQYQAAVENLKAEQQLAAQSMGVFGQQALDTKVKLDAQKQSADGLRNAIQALNDVNRAALGGMIGFEQAIDDAAEAAKKNAGALTMTGGKLDLNSQKARDAAAALQTLGTKTDEAAAAAREADAPWTQINDIYRRGQTSLIATARAMGLTKEQAALLAAQIITIPDVTETKVEMDREDALAGLDQVIEKIQATPGTKSVVVSAITAEAISLLQQLGYKTEKLPNGQVRVTAQTGTALAGISAVQEARDRLQDRTITITTRDVRITEHINRQQTSRNVVNANGNVLAGAETFADGGMREKHTAQIARPHATYRIWAEPETGGESYIPLAPSKRPRSRAIAEETIRRLGGDPRAIVWNANGGIHAFASGGFSYTPTALRRSAGDVQSRYDETHQPITREDYNKAIRARADAVDRLRDAEAKLREVRSKKHTAAQLAAAERQVASARRALTTATENASKAETRYRQKFSLTDWAKTLKDAISANGAWESNLQKIAARGGGDIIGMLRDLGEEGAAMVAALAKSSNKQFREIVSNLRKLGPLAKATLADLTKQLNGSNQTTAAFQQNLATLSAQGFGDLATMLAAQGDEAAQKLAVEAVKDKKKASAANDSAKTANKQLSQDELASLVQIIAAVKTSRIGIHDVAATTGLGEDEIITIANKASAQIKKSLGSRSTKFLADLARANRGLAYANGGIREGIYSTRAGAVTFAEPSTGGEAYIPLGSHKRSRALPVLREAARRMGVGLTDARSSQQIVVLPGSTGDTNINVSTLRTGATAHQIAAEIDRQQRRARRGGVATR